MRNFVCVVRVTTRFFKKKKNDFVARLVTTGRVRRLRRRTYVCPPPHHTRPVRRGIQRRLFAVINRAIPVVAVIIFAEFFTGTTGKKKTNGKYFFAKMTVRRRDGKRVTTASPATDPIVLSVTTFEFRRRKIAVLQR